MKKSASVLMSIMVLFAGHVYAQESDDIDALLRDSARLRQELSQLMETKPFAKAVTTSSSISEKAVESKKAPLAKAMMNPISEKATEPEEAPLADNTLLSESADLRQALNQLVEAGKAKPARKAVTPAVRTYKSQVDDESQLTDEEMELISEQVAEPEKQDKQTGLIEDLDEASNENSSDNVALTGTDCVVFDYQQGNVNDICLKPGFITDIVLPAGEELKKVTLGNDMYFDVKTYANYSGDGSWHIYVNPIQKNVETNMVIATDVRNYYVQLMSGNMYFPFVKWNVKDSMVVRNGKKVNPSELLTMEVDSIKDLHFDYASTPKKKIKVAPVSVFDDKYWNTYLVFEAGKLNSIEPLIFAEKENGSLEIIPYKKVEDTIVLKRVCSDFMVKVGDGYIKYHRKS